MASYNVRREKHGCSSTLASYSANVDDMKIGDPVEFQMSFDRKTGKPIAIAVVPMEPGSVSFEVSW